MPPQNVPREPYQARFVDTYLDPSTLQPVVREGQLVIDDPRPRRAAEAWDADVLGDGTKFDDTGRVTIDPGSTVFQEGVEDVLDGSESQLVRFYVASGDNIVGMDASLINPGFDATDGTVTGSMAVVSETSFAVATTSNHPLLIATNNVTRMTVGTDDTTTWQNASGYQAVVDLSGDPAIKVSAEGKTAIIGVDATGVAIGSFTSADLEFTTNNVLRGTVAGATNDWYLPSSANPSRIELHPEAVEPNVSVIGASGTGILAAGTTAVSVGSYTNAPTWILQNNTSRITLNADGSVDINAMIIRLNGIELQATGGTITLLGDLQVGMP